MRSSPLLSPLAWLLGAAACNSVVGVEELHEGPRDGASGTHTTGTDEVRAGASSNPGKTTPSGGKSAGGASTSEGGADNPALGGTESTGVGGTDSTALVGPDTTPLGGGGQSAAAEGGQNAGGQPDALDMTVRGRVIDFWGNAAANLPVQLGEVLTSTDADGLFVVPDAPATYDVSLVYNMSDPVIGSAWAYQGLTRRDPTLQVFDGARARSAPVKVSFTPTPTLAARQAISLSLGGPNGSSVFRSVSASGGSYYAWWAGPSTAAQTAHALLWERDAKGAAVAYKGFDFADLVLPDGATPIALDLTEKVIDTGNLAGTVTRATLSNPYHRVFVRFSSSASIQVVERAADSNSFSYLTPRLPNSRLTVAAYEGYDISEHQGYAIAHAGGLEPGAQVALVMPTPVTLIGPGSGAENVTTATKFSFTSGPETPGPFVVAFANMSTGAGLPRQIIHVVTAKKELTLPTIIGGEFRYFSDREYHWSVATHGKYESVDAMAAPGGFLNEFSLDTSAPSGPARPSGEYTHTESRFFTTAP